MKHFTRREFFKLFTAPALIGEESKVANSPWIKPESTIEQRVEDLEIQVGALRGTDTWHGQRFNRLETKIRDIKADINQKTPWYQYRGRKGGQV